MTAQQAEALRSQGYTPRHYYETTPELRAAIAQTLQAYIADVNRRGGIYNRHLQLELEDLPEAAQPSESVATFLRRRPPSS